MDEKQERNWTVVCHLGGIIPAYFLNFIIPFLIWLLKKNDSAFLNEQGREIVNFQLSLCLYGIALALVFFTVVGMPLAIIGGIALEIINIVSIIRGAIKASSGEKFLYPINLRLLK